MGYQASESKAKKIYALASDGIPTLASSLPSTKMLLEEAVESLYHIDTTLANILSQMKMSFILQQNQQLECFQLKFQMI